MTKPAMAYRLVPESKLLEIANSLRSAITALQELIEQESEVVRIPVLKGEAIRARIGKEGE